ncbi:SnoaL-like domain-containing protein [Dyella koreensis]|uniref:Nuclear transport factor 2 family protein n=1 Tax=Dyella koreensis TaxID=311235 RepID=A0ABW8K2X6_9GAMM
MSVETVAKRLVALCREGKYEEAQKELYAKNAESIEPEGAPPGSMGNVKGLDAIFEKGKQFQASIEQVHGGSISDPIVAGNWFSCSMTLDVTMKQYGRVNMTEICVYHVNKDGKVDKEQFFYDVG